MYKSCQEWENKSIACRASRCFLPLTCLLYDCLVFLYLAQFMAMKSGHHEIGVPCKSQAQYKVLLFLHDATQYPEKFCSYMTRKSEKWLLLWRADTCRLWEVELNPNERWHASTSVWFEKQWKAMEAGNRWFERQRANHDITAKLLRKFHFNEASLF